MPNWHRSSRVATRRQSFSRPNMISRRLRRLSWRTDAFRAFRPGMQGSIPSASRASRNRSAPASSGLDRFLILRTPRMVRLDEAVLDAVCLADHVEAHLPGPTPSCWRGRSQRTSRQDDPVRNRERMPLITRRSSMRGTPRLFPGKSGSINATCDPTVHGDACQPPSQETETDQPKTVPSRYGDTV
jgi:hypothetical protein